MHKGNRTASENGSEADVYYGNMNSQQKLPFRSFAPELFDDGKMIFDKSTDVWAYGIILIEMYRLGSMPYPTIANPRELMHFFTLGKIHAKPHLCPKDMYANIIQACFSIKKRDRPTFSMLAMQLKQIKLDIESSTTTTFVSENFNLAEDEPNSHRSVQPLQPGFTSKVPGNGIESLPNDSGVISQSFNQIMSSPLQDSKSRASSDIIGQYSQYLDLPAEDFSDSKVPIDSGVISQSYNQIMSSPLQDSKSRDFSDSEVPIDEMKYTDFSGKPVNWNRMDSEVPIDEMKYTDFSDSEVPIDEMKYTTNSFC